MLSVFNGKMLTIAVKITKRKMPLVFLNGNAEGITSELRTVKTNLKVKDNENELSFLFVSDGFDYISLSDDPCEPHMQSYETQFFSQYINCLRIISYIPENILKLIKDKRLLAIGYKNDEIKTAIKNYIGNRYENACVRWEKSNETSEFAGKYLAACKQFKKFPYAQSLHNLLQETYITDFYNACGEVRITNDIGETAILANAKTIIEECNPKYAYINAYELYENENDYEVHFLLSQKDENFIDRFYYATYSFTDMMLKN